MHALSSPSQKPRRRYVSALRLIPDAIQDPSRASRDSALLAAMLIDLFEKMTNKEPQSKGAWMSHVNGAFTLVHLRSARQFN